MIGRRKFLVTTSTALPAGATVLGGGQTAQASVDPSKPPLNVRVASVSGNTVTLTWTPPANNNFWWIYIYDNDAKEFIIDAGKSGATLKRLRSGTTHTFTAIYGEFTDDPKHPGPNFNVSAPSAPVQVTLRANSDTRPPAVPGHVRSEPQGDGSSFLTTWDPSTDDVTPQARIQYDVVNWTGFTQFYGATSGTTDWGPAGVRAVDEAGNRSAVG
ncbi:fibronectin type III domain-containing protein [Actinopolymorpha pittospori]